MGLKDRFVGSFVFYGAFCFMVNSSVALGVGRLVGEDGLRFLVGVYFVLPVLLALDVMEHWFLKWWNRGD